MLESSSVPASLGSPSPASSRQDLAGRVLECLPQYKVSTRVLGKGSYGEVLLGQHVRSKRLVAIKAIDRSHVHHLEEAEKMMREFDILTSLEHENVVALREVAMDSRSLFLVLEYCDWGSLERVLSKCCDGAGLDESAARSIFSQIVEAVRYCHGKGIVHRQVVHVD